MKRANRHAPSGRMIEVGAVTFASDTTFAADTRRRNRIETRLRAVEEFERFIDTLPVPMGAIVASCARAGIRPGQGKERNPLSQTDKDAREAALKEAPAFLQQYRAQAKAEAVQRRMQEFGVHPTPSIESILKRGLRSRSPT